MTPPDTPPMNYRATFSLPPALAVGISTVAKRMGVSQSALLANLLTGPIADLERLTAIVADGPVTPEKIRHARGASVAIVARRVAETLAECADDLEQANDPNH